MEELSEWGGKARLGSPERPGTGQPHLGSGGLLSQIPRAACSLCKDMHASHVLVEMGIQRWGLSQCVENQLHKPHYS